MSGAQTYIKATIQANRQLVHEEKAKLDQLSEGPIKSIIDQLEARKTELLAQLEECNTELDMEHKMLADLPKSVEEQKTRLKSAIKNVADLTKSLRVIPGAVLKMPEPLKKQNKSGKGYFGYPAIFVSVTFCVLDLRHFCYRLRYSCTLLS